MTLQIYGVPDLQNVCGAECEFAEGSHERTIADAAIVHLMQGWPREACGTEPTRRELRQRQREAKRHKKDVEQAIGPVVGLDPITGFILWELVSFVAGKVFDWLFNKWFGDAHFAERVQFCACSMAA